MNGNGNGRPAMPPMPTAGPNPYEGIPYRGTPMDVKADDPQYKQPQVHYEAHIKIFNLNDTDHLREYEDICNKTAKQHCVIGVEKIEYCEDIASWRVLLRWYDQFLAAPEEATGEQSTWNSDETS